MLPTAVTFTIILLWRIAVVLGLFAVMFFAIHITFKVWMTYFPVLKTYDYILIFGVLMTLKIVTGIFDVLCFPTLKRYATTPIDVKRPIDM